MGFSIRHLQFVKEKADSWLRVRVESVSVTLCPLQNVEKFKEDKYFWTVPAARFRLVDLPHQKQFFFSFSFFLLRCIKVVRCRFLFLTCHLTEHQPSSTCSSSQIPVLLSCCCDWQWGKCMIPSTQTIAAKQCCHLQPFLCTIWVQAFIIIGNTPWNAAQCLVLLFHRGWCRSWSQCKASAVALLQNQLVFALAESRTRYITNMWPDLLVVSRGSCRFCPYVYL